MKSKEEKILDEKLANFYIYKAKKAIFEAIYNHYNIEHKFVKSPIIKESPSRNNLTNDCIKKPTTDPIFVHFEKFPKLVKKSFDNLIKAFEKLNIEKADKVNAEEIICLVLKDRIIRKEFQLPEKKDKEFHKYLKHFPYNEGKFLNWEGLLEILFIYKELSIIKLEKIPINKYKDKFL